MYSIPCISQLSSQSICMSDVFRIISGTLLLTVWSLLIIYMYSTVQLIRLPSQATCWVHRESNPRPTYWGHWSQDHSPQVGCSRHARPSLLCPWLPVAGSMHTGIPHMTLPAVPLTSSRRGKTRMFPWHKVIGLLAMGTLLDQALCPLEIP
jgi:hypothetical protein